MATTGTDTATTSHAEGDAHGVHHPTPRQYVNIALLLGFLTAIEVATYYFRLPEWALWVGLTGLAVAKFVTVVGYYMHLKYDSRMFQRLFVFGIGLALFVFLLVLGIFALETVEPSAAN